jgi:hypothetical protein
VTGEPSAEVALCLVEEWDEQDEDWDECDLEEGHHGAHAHERDDGTRVYWRTDGVDVLTGAKP